MLKPKNKKCPVCGTLFSPRGKRDCYCSAACKMKAQRQRCNPLLDDNRIRYSPLVKTILRNAVRSGTLAIIKGVKLQELNTLVNNSKMTCFETGQSFHLSHYISSVDHGSLSPLNIGIWPAWLNNKLSYESLPVGHRVSDNDWQDSSLFCTSEDEAYRILIKKWGTELSKLQDFHHPKRFDRYQSLVRRGCKLSFSQVYKLTDSEFDALLIKFSLKPAAEPKPKDSDKVIKTVRDTLRYDLIKQSKQYPSIVKSSEIVPLLTRLARYPDDVAIDCLSLAILHKFKEARLLMNAFEPDEHKPISTHNQNGNYTVELHRWLDEHNNWRTTEVPSADFYKSPDAIEFK